MFSQRDQTILAALPVLFGAVAVWGFSAAAGAQDVHPRFPLAMQLYGVYLLLIAMMSFPPPPVPAMGRFGLWNALGLGIGGLIIGASRSGALLAIPLVCLGIGLALWPPAPRPESARLPTLILVIGGILAAIIPAAWIVYL